MHKRRQQGYTIFELMLVIGMMGAIALMAALGCAFMYVLWHFLSMVW